MICVIVQPALLAVMIHAPRIRITCPNAPRAALKAVFLLGNPMGKCHAMLKEEIHCPEALGACIPRLR